MSADGTIIMLKVKLIHFFKKNTYFKCETTVTLPQTVLFSVNKKLKAACFVD
jgi:hypothetical protein